MPACPCLPAPVPTEGGIGRGRQGGRSLTLQSVSDGADEVRGLFCEKILMLFFPVSEEKNRWLKEKMEALGIQEKDIEEKFIRSSGSGGQKVNKTSTCVYLKHIPTGVEIKWMRERNQSLNRFLARRELILRIEKLSGRLTPEEVKSERARRQKLKRKKRAKQKYRCGE